MLDICKLFNKVHITAQERGWDVIYIAIDWHDTIAYSTYDDNTAIHFYTHCLDVLKLLSDDPKYKLILFTSSYSDKCDNLQIELAKHDIQFDYINANPEVSNSEFGDFTSKFYYNMLLDDKSGFEPDVDWGYLLVLIEMYNDHQHPDALMYKYTSIFPNLVKAEIVGVQF